MIRAGGNVCVWLATSPVDMRRGFDRLAEHVRSILAHDPLCGHLFVFRNRSGERVKILWWDQDGFAIPATQCPRESHRLVSVASAVSEGCDSLF